MANTIWFDMDGTIYPLYKQENWLERLEDRESAIFSVGQTRKTLPQIRAIIRTLIRQGWTVGVITWAPKDVTSNDLYFDDVRNAKMQWLGYYFPEIKMENFFCLEYGTPKAEIIPKENKFTHILIDDNKVIRKMWRDCGKNFLTINANKGFCKILKGLVM